jgi:polyisoprenyl-phosphate glycosyltransferase
VPRHRMKIAVVIPAYNEEKNLPLLYERLTSVMSKNADEHELVFVNDGSRDKTLEVLRGLSEADPRVKYVSLSRNFGHEIAVAAGLDRAEGDAVALMDADLQDPPELISKMIERWRAGVDVVYAQRRKRKDPPLKRASIYVFYRILGQISEIDIPLDTGNFRLMDRRVVQVLRECRENPRYVRGLVSWVGFKQEPLLFDREARHAGETNYGLRKLIKLALDGVCSFSVAPLRASAWLGTIAIGLSVLALLVVVIDKLFISTAAPRGFAFLACAMFFLGGVQLFMLGMLAEYIGYVFKNVQNRPMYVVSEEANFAARGPRRTAYAGRPVSGVTAEGWNAQVRQAGAASPVVVRAGVGDAVLSDATPNGVTAHATDGGAEGAPRG